MINDANIVSGKRERKPKDLFSPESYQKTPKPRNSSGAPRRNRNEAADTTKLNRWDNYRLLVKRALVNLTKELHYVDVYTQQQKANIDPRDSQMMRFNAKILQYKEVIYSTLAALDAENSEHKRWPELAEADEDDMVDVDNVFCSVCNLEESEDNDILFCDRAGCLRAYHQLCLDPPVTLASFDPDQDWFCWKCECMDDCLEVIGEKLDRDVNSYTELFPELRQEVKKGDTLFSTELADDDDDEEGQDDEFEPVEEERDDDELDASSDDEDNEDTGQQQGEGDEGNGEDEQEEQEGAESLLHQLQTLNEEAGADSADEDDQEGEGEDSAPLSDLDSDLDEDEITLLLQEADKDADATHILADSSNNNNGRYKLRDRSAQKKALTVDDMIIHHSNADINRPIAIIRRGVFILGAITAYDAESDTWTLSYSSDAYKYKDTVTSDVITVQQALLRYHEHQTLQTQLTAKHAMQEKISMLVNQSGVLSDANIVSGSRRKENVDYVQLSLQMFGSLVDEDDIGVEDDDYHEKTVHASNGNSRRQSKSNGNSSTRQSKAAAQAKVQAADWDSEEEQLKEEREEDEVSEEEYDPRANKANGKKRKRGGGGRGRSSKSPSSTAGGRKKKGRGRPRKVFDSDEEDDDDEEEHDSGEDESDEEGYSSGHKKAKKSDSNNDNNGMRRFPSRTSRASISSYAPPSSEEDDEEEDDNGDEEAAHDEGLGPVEAAGVEEIVALGDGDGEVELVAFDEDEEDMDVVQEAI